MSLPQRPPTPLRRYDGTVALGALPPPPEADVQEHIKRPSNSFMLFRSELVKHCKDEPQMQGAAQAEVSKLASIMWKSMSDDAKGWYDVLQEKEKAKHEKKYPNYKFKPRTSAEKAAAKEQKARQKAAEREAKRAAKSRRSGGNRALQPAYSSVATYPVEEDERLPRDPTRYSPPISLAATPVLRPRVLPPDQVPQLPVVSAMPFNAAAASKAMEAVEAYRAAEDARVAAQAQSSRSSGESSKDSTPASELGADVWQNLSLPAGPSTLNLWAPPSAMNTMDWNFGAPDLSTGNWDPVVFGQMPPGAIDVTMQHIPAVEATEPTTGFLNNMTVASYADPVPSLDDLAGNIDWDALLAGLGSNPPSQMMVGEESTLTQPPFSFDSMQPFLDPSSSGTPSSAGPSSATPHDPSPIDSNDIMDSFVDFQLSEPDFAPFGRDRMDSNATIMPSSSSNGTINPTILGDLGTNATPFQFGANSPAIFMDLPIPQSVTVPTESPLQSIADPPSLKPPSSQTPRTPQSRSSSGTYTQSRHSSGTYTLSEMLDPFASPPKVDKGKGKAREDQPYAPPAGATRVNMRRAAGKWTPPV